MVAKDTGKDQTTVTGSTDAQSDAVKRTLALHAGLDTPPKHYTAAELVAKAQESRAKINSTLNAFDPSKLSESLRLYTQVSTALGQQDGQFKRDLGSKPTAPDNASAHAEGFLMRSQANLAANVYMKTMTYLQAHPDQASSLVPALNKFWQQIGHLEPGILYDDGFKNFVAASKQKLGPAMSAQLDSTMPPLIATTPVVRIAPPSSQGEPVSTETANLSQRPPAGNGLLHGPIHHIDPAKIRVSSSRVFTTNEPARTTTGGQAPNMELRAAQADSGTTASATPGWLQGAAIDHKALLPSEQNPPAPPVRTTEQTGGTGKDTPLTLTQSRWNDYLSDQNDLEKKLWGPYAQNQQTYDKALEAVKGVKTAATSQLGADTDFMTRFINATDDATRTSILKDPKYKIAAGSPVDVAVQNLAHVAETPTHLAKGEDPTWKIINWAIDHEVLRTAQKVADPVDNTNRAPEQPVAAKTDANTALDLLKSDADKAEGAYNKNNKAQVDAQLKQELDAVTAATNSNDSTAAIDHMRKANAIIMQMAAPAVDRRWLGDEYRAHAHGIDPEAESDPKKRQQLISDKNDLSYRSVQQYQAAVADSELLNQPLLQRATDQLSYMMQRTLVGKPDVIAEFSTMKAKILGAGSDQTESMTDMVYQNSKKLAFVQAESHHYEEAKTALAAAIKTKGWTPETATKSDADYGPLSAMIATGLPENEKGQILYHESSIQSELIAAAGFVGYFGAKGLFKKFAPEAMAESFGGKMAAGTVGALAAGELMNHTMGDPQSLGDMAFNSLVGPVALHGGAQLARVGAEGMMPGVADKIFGDSVTKQKLLQRIANDVGKGELSAGQLFDFAQGKQINPESFGLHAPPPGDAAALERWRATPVFKDGHVVYSGAELLTGSKAQLNQWAGQMFASGPSWNQVVQRMGQAVHQDVPTNVSTKEDFLNWAGQHDKPNLPKYEQALQDVGSQEVIFRKGQLVKPGQSVAQT